MQQKGVMQQPAGAFSSPMLIGLILLALGQHGCAQQQLPRQEFTVDLDAADTPPLRQRCSHALLRVVTRGYRHARRLAA